MTNSLKQHKYLANLKAEHNALDDLISKLVKSKIVNQFELQALKKQKLQLKELIFKQYFKAVSAINDN